MKTLLTYLVGFTATINPVFASITLATVSVLALFSWMNQQWTQLIAKIDAMTQASFAGTLSFEPLALINTLLPLTEGLGYFTAWLAILGICTTIRVIKSFIPAIAT